MERHFELELEKLNKRLIKMGNLVAEQVHNVFEALLKGDGDLAHQIIEKDSKVDKLDNKIDKLCQRLFALTQPVATDLRLIMAALRINNDLERMGDHAVAIAQKIEGISDYNEIIKELQIDEIVKMTDMIVNDVITILNTKNVAFVKDIFDLASSIDEKIQAATAKIMEEMMRKSDVIVVATNLIIILTNIDRLAGYSTNIAESIVFVVDGRIMKHKKKSFDILSGALATEAVQNAAPASEHHKEGAESNPETSQVKDPNSEATPSAG
ncbi:MAG: phosphate signaling complex protein PhoU [Bacteroidetes bacterium]|nr:phosphate signaling complex protein PhoU [Bacteroidota bacterium]